MISSELSNFRWRQLLLIVNYFCDSALTCDWLKIFTAKCLYFRDRFLARAKDYLTDHMFKNAVNIEVMVFSRGMPIPNQTFNFKFYLQDSHFFSSCPVLPRLAFVFKLTCIGKVNIFFQVVLTRFT